VCTQPEQNDKSHIGFGSESKSDEKRYTRRTRAAMKEQHTLGVERSIEMTAGPAKSKNSFDDNAYIESSDVASIDSGAHLSSIPSTSEHNAKNSDYMAIDNIIEPAKELQLLDASSIRGSDRRKRTDKNGVTPDIGTFMNVLTGFSRLRRSAYFLPNCRTRS
jgi:hypothetical protein